MNGADYSLIIGAVCHKVAAALWLNFSCCIGQWKTGWSIKLTKVSALTFGSSKCISSTSTLSRWYPCSFSASKSYQRKIHASVTFLSSSSMEQHTLYLLLPFFLTTALWSRFKWKVVTDRWLSELHDWAVTSTGYGSVFVYYTKKAFSECIFH